MKTVLLALVLALSAQAGVGKVITFPVRHPVKTFVRAPVRVVEVLAFPVVHPKRFWW
jgi:hypothetical protein